MRIHFVWLDSTCLFNPEDYSIHGKHKKIFWVSASEQEAREILVPHMFAASIQVFEAYRSESDPYIGECSMVNDDSYFIVSADLEIITPFLRVYPVSAMWPQTPWRRFERSFNSLDELAILNTSAAIPAKDDPSFGEEYLTHAWGC